MVSGKALLCSLALLTACKPQLRPGEIQEAAPAAPAAAASQTPIAAPDTGAIQVLQVAAARYQDEPSAPQGLRERCAAWSLRPDQVAAFFAASREYTPAESTELNDGFYRLPCSIEGRLRADGAEWEYEINAAATGVWRAGERTRTFGCSAAACEPLVLMMPDGNAP